MIQKKHARGAGRGNVVRGATVCARHRGQHDGRGELQPPRARGENVRRVVRCQKRLRTSTQEDMQTPGIDETENMRAECACKCSDCQAAPPRSILAC
eukprot:1660368-Pleurochrysis_carterae.AAC.2